MRFGTCLLAKGISGQSARRLMFIGGGDSCGRSEHGPSEVVVLVRAVLRVTAVYLASCGVGYGRAPIRPTTGPENVPAEGGLKILLQRPGMLPGGEMPRRAWEVATAVLADARPPRPGWEMPHRAWEVASDVIAAAF
jgi:hypothetical protein